nr:putative transcriptional regulatory protein [Quercus suber]
MLAVHSGNMYHGGGHPSMGRSHDHFQPTHTYPSPVPSGQVYPPRNLIQLPRLPESQPYARTSTPISTQESRRHDSTSGPSTCLESRLQGPVLPAFKDIFSPNSAQSSASPTFGASWNSRPGLPPSDMTSNTHKPHADQRSTLTHRHTPSLSLQTLPTLERRIDGRTAGQSAVSHSSGQPIPNSPYAAYPDPREQMGYRPDGMGRDSPVAYRNNGTLSPYAPGPADEHSYMSPRAAYDHSSSHNASSGPECQRLYLGVKEIPGEGHFHLYDGGYRIPTQIDGEQVNPAWGLTKANKPRKRLALACLDCREKKIKCEPGANSCVQCEKAKRPCRRAPLQSLNGDTPPAATWSSSAGSPPRTEISGGHTTNDVETEYNRKRRSRDEPSSPATVAKKHRSISPVLNGKTASPTINHLMSDGSTVGRPRPTERSRHMYAWEEDPFNTEPETTLYLLDSYLMHVNNATICMFPRNAFWHWVKTDMHKSAREVMVLHAVLAVGSIFADDRYAVVGKRHCHIAADALAAAANVSDLFGVQTRLLLALFYSAKDSESMAWEYTGAAVRAATNNDLRLNVEDEAAEEQRCKTDPGALTQANVHANSHFSFSRQQYQECKRRTFWACFLKDRFGAGTLCAINLQDIHLRLPSTDHMYEHSIRSEAPYYNNGIVEPLDASISATSPVCAVGWLVQVAAIWGDVLNFTNRSVHRGNSTYRESYDSFYSETEMRMQDWVSRLPEYLHYSPKNLEQSIRGDYADTFISMHAVYHFIHMKLNRYVRHAAVRDVIARNIRAAVRHARELLAVMTALRSTICERISPLTGQRCDFIPTTAFIGNITLAAIDIAGAGGLDTSLASTLEDIEGGLGCLIILARCWTSARTQHRESQKRYYQIQNMVHQPYKARGGCWLGREWGMMDPLERDFEAKDDCIYGATEDSGKPNEIYFNALKSVQDDASYQGGQREERQAYFGGSISILSSWHVCTRICIFSFERLRENRSAKSYDLFERPTLLVISEYEGGKCTCLGGGGGSESTGPAERAYAWASKDLPGRFRSRLQRNLRCRHRTAGRCTTAVAAVCWLGLLDLTIFVRGQPASCLLYLLRVLPIYLPTPLPSPTPLSPLRARMLTHNIAGRFGQKDESVWSLADLRLCVSR